MAKSAVRRSCARLLALVAVVASADSAIACSAPSPSLVAGPVVVDVIGDSLSTGVATGGEAWTRNAEPLFGGTQRNVLFVNAAENGAGYVARGSNGDTFLAEVDKVVSKRAQIVLLFGSDNDVAEPGLDAAVAQTFRRVRALAPLATLIVIGPPAPPAQRAQPLQGIRDLLKTAVRNAGGGSSTRWR